MLLAISAVLAIVIGLFGSASMVWRGSPGLSAPVAVPVAVRSGDTGSINASLCDVSPAHGRAPPAGVDGLIHTYYVLAGKTPVLVHNCGGGSAGDSLLSTNSSGSGGRLPMTMECVCQVAGKYGIDISDVRININKALDGYAGSTAPNGPITLTRAAFRNEEQLARTLAHETFHGGQIRSGMGYPTTYDAGNAWETAAQATKTSGWRTIGSGLQ